MQINYVMYVIWLYEDRLKFEYNDKVGLVEVLHINKAWHDNGLPKINYVTSSDISMPIFFSNNAKDFAIFYLNC